MIYNVRKDENMKKIFITFLGLLLVLGISDCQKSHVNVEDVAKKLYIFHRIYFKQKVMK